MFYVKKISGVLLLIAVATAYATEPKEPTITEAVAHNSSRVAVISVVGDTFTHEYPRFKLIDDYESKDVSKWGIDTIYEEQIANEVTRLFPKVVVVKSPYSRSDFTPVNRKFMVPDWSAIEDAAKKYCSSNSLDFLFVLSKDRPLRFISRSFPYGLSFYTEKRIFGENKSHMQLGAELSVLSCTTGKVFASEIVTVGDRHGNGIPSIQIPLTISKLSTEEWSKTLEESIRDDFIKLPLQTWQPTLERMFSEIIPKDWIPNSISAEIKNNTKHIAVISLISDKFENINIQQFELDAIYAHQIADEIAKHWSVSIAKIHNSESDWPKNSSPSKDIAKYFCRKTASDALFVVRKNWMPSIDSPGMWFFGFGLITKKSTSEANTTYASLAASLRFIDCKTGKTTAMREVATNHHGSYLDLVRSAPFVEIPLPEGYATVARWSDAEQKTIREALIQLPANAWGPTLQAMLPASR